MITSASRLANATVRASAALPSAEPTVLTGRPGVVAP